MGIRGDPDRGRLAMDAAQFLIFAAGLAAVPKNLSQASRSSAPRSCSSFATSRSLL